MNPEHEPMAILDAIRERRAGVVQLDILVTSYPLLALELFEQAGEEFTKMLRFDTRLKFEAFLRDHRSTPAKK